MTGNEFITAYAAGERDYRLENLTGVNMRGANMTFASLRGVNMRGADMIFANMRGVDMCDADMSGVDMRDADMREADMRRVNMRGADMRGVDMLGVDMRDADMRGADMKFANMRGVDMRGADMSGADMRGAIMTGARMTGAIGLPPAPVIANLHTKIYAAASQPNALNMNSWHTCATTHCRAGWAIVLAGDAGISLEVDYEPAFAAALIYAASYQNEPIPDFYPSNEDALEDMKRLAEREIGQ